MASGKKAPVRGDVKKTVELSEENGAFLTSLPWGMQKRLVNSLLDEARKIMTSKGMVGIAMIMEKEIGLKES